MEHRHISFIGAGNMTHSIVAGLINSHYPADKITVTNPSIGKLEQLANHYGVHTTQDNRLGAEKAEVIVLAVKPQIMENVASDLQSVDYTNKLVISIAAGISATRLNEMFNTKLNLIRVMPNTPSLIRKGMSGLFSVEDTSEQDRMFAGNLLSAVGEICWVDKESDINTVIAAAGSAPAYFFLFMEAMQAEAMKQGFSEKMARSLVQQAALGAAEMVIANPETDLSTLREQVTSKGGVTAEALHTFNHYKLQEIVAAAMQSAITRAEEMETLF